MNYNVPLELFLPPPATYPSINCLVTDDHRGLNNGVFFLRVNDWSIWLMTAVLGYQKAGCRPPGKLRTEDQGALENIITEVNPSHLKGRRQLTDISQPQFINYTIHVPQRWFNAFAGFRDESLTKTTKFKSNSAKEGDLLVHFAGHKDTREETMKKWLNYREKHVQEWEMKVEKTGYLEEIRQFWDVEAEKEIAKKLRFFPGESAMLD